MVYDFSKTLSNYSEMLKNNSEVVMDFSGVLKDFSGVLKDFSTEERDGLEIKRLFLPSWKPFHQPKTPFFIIEPYSKLTPAISGRGPRTRYKETFSFLTSRTPASAAWLG
jgi:hypothetical protein